MKAARNIPFEVVERKTIAEDIVSLSIAPKDGSSFSFTPGQYISIALPTHPHILQEKQYTISSIPSDEHVVITIKKMGVFSGALHELAPGDPLLIEGPSGDFYPQAHMREIVLLAAGIGVTPFYSVIRDRYARRDEGTRLSLAYTVRSVPQAAFVEELRAIESSWSSFSLLLHTTAQAKRMTVDTIQKRLSPSPEASFFICGPNGFVIDMWKGLLAKGVHEDHLFLESFF